MNLGSYNVSAVTLILADSGLNMKNEYDIKRRSIAISYV